MTDTANQPTDDSKEELTEAELDQVAGGEKVQFGSSS
jgi:bacteriocin-like protein